MKIHKALKVKNRLAGEVAQLQQIFNRENSRRNDNPSKIDPATVLRDLNKKREELFNLKGAISQATAPIQPLLAELEERKSEINFMNSVPCREGTEIVPMHQSEPIKYVWKAYMTRAELDDRVAALQLRINNLQDQIDDFNAKTDI